MATQKKNIPKLGPSKKSDAPAATPNASPRPSNAGARKASTPALRPAATPTQSSTELPKRKPPKLPSRQGSGVSHGSDQTRKSSLAARRPSNLSGRTESTDQGRRPPKLPKKQTSGLASKPAPAGRPSASTRKPSNVSSAAPGAEAKRKPPKLAPKSSSTKAGANDSSKQQERKGSTPVKVKQAQPKKNDQAAHNVDEEQQDLKSILSESQCEDLITLTANITSRMRKTVDDNFNATVTLTKIGKEDKDKDKFASLDYDPGTVDVAAYDKEKKLRDERQKELSTPKVKELKAASLKWFDDWRDDFLKRVDETVSLGKRTSLQQAKSEGPTESSLAQARPVQKLNAGTKDAEAASPKLESLFPRVPTSLTKMPLGQRTLVLHSFLLLLLSLEHYNAASRVFLLYLTSSLKLGLKALRDDEEKTAKGLLEAAKQISASKATLAKGKESEESRRWKMRLATVAGAAIVGLSGGYAAPMIAASVGAMMSEMGLGASAAAGYLGAVASNTYLVGSLFGAYGGRMTGEMMRNLSADVQDFAFLPVHGERKEHEDSIDAVTDTRRLRVIIAISGWLLEKEEVVTPWHVLKPSAEVFALRFELETLMSFGQSINTMTSNDAYGFAQSAFTQRSMVTDLTSAIWPIALVKIARVVENPFSLAKARADKAGKVLAEALINRSQGERPVTLVGYSTGARVIWSCLTSLAERKAFGLVESVVMLGAPVPSDIGTWRSMRTAVSGRLINVYSKNDYLLAFLYRTSSLQYGVAGLMPISGLSGVENFDVSESVSGHLRYRYLVGSILQKIGFEDLDKNEVTKEADSFKKMTEEENKHDYVEEVSKGAGEIYKQYTKRGKQPPTKKISDKEADKQVSDMEKEIQQNTQKGLMQWAVEQLYLSRPSPPSTEDIKNAKSDPQAAAKGTTKTVNKTADAATKSMYQRAKEAVYISRSGGAEGEDAAKGKLADAQATTSSAVPSSYLTTAAGYIPTSYIPGFGVSATGTENPQKKAGKTVENLGAKTSEPQGISKDVKDKTKAVDNAKESTKGTEISIPKRAESTLQKEKSASDDPPSTGPATDAQKEAGGIPNNASAQVPAKDNSPDDATEKSGSTNKSDTTAPDHAPEARSSSGYSSYIPSFGFSSSSKGAQPEASDKAPSTSENVDSTTDQGSGSPEEGPHSESTDTTPTNGREAKKDSKPAEKASGYGSYIPSFGFGRSAPSKPQSSAETPKDDPKVDANNKAEGTDAAQGHPDTEEEATEKPKASLTDSETDNDGQQRELEDPFVD